MSNSEKTLKRELIKGSFWSIFGQFITLFITFISNIILAKLLSPNEFGQMGIIMFFLAVLSVLTESGLGGALVRNKDATQIDYSTVFVANLFLSVFLFIVIFLLSNPIAEFYNDNEISKILIASSTIILINAFQISQNARLVSNFRFKQKYLYKFLAALLSSIIGIILAYQGFGIWSLVYLQISNAFFFTCLLWICERSDLSFKFSSSSFKSMSSFGIYTTLSSIVTSVFDNIYQLVLAKYFSLNLTGNYYQAKRLQEVPGGVLNMVSQGVVFSLLAKLQDDKEKFTRIYNIISKYFIIILGLVSIITFGYAKPLILLLFGENWIESIYFMQMLTVASFFYMQENLNRVIFKVYNRTNLILYLDVVKKIIQSLSIVLGVLEKNLNVLIIGFVISSIISYGLNFYISRKVLGKVEIYELIIFIKILLAVILTCFSIYTFNIYVNVSSIQNILTIPFSFLLFLVVLWMSNVISIKEIKKVIQISSWSKT